MTSTVQIGGDPEFLNPEPRNRERLQGTYAYTERVTFIGLKFYCIWTISSLMMIKQRPRSNCAVLHTVLLPYPTTDQNSNLKLS